MAIRQKLNLQTAPPPDGQVFWPINMAWRNLIEGHPRNISTKLFENRPDTFGGEDFLSFHFSHIGQNSPTLWRPCFSTNQHGLKESDRGSPKKNFYIIIWKLAKHFRRRRSLSFHLIKSHPRNLSTKLFENGTDTFRGEVFLNFQYSHIKQNSPPPLAAMFLVQSTWLEGIW